MSGCIIILQNLEICFWGASETQQARLSMGSDIYRYEVLEIKGRSVIIFFKSAQQCGLAPETSSRGKEGEEDDRGKQEAWAFWVCALSEHDKAFGWTESYDRYPNCAITKHERWREPTGDVIIVGDDDSLTMDSLKDMMGDLSCGSYGIHSMGDKMRGSVSFSSLDDAKKFIDEWNGKPPKETTTNDNAAPFHVYFKNVVDGPEWLDHYSRPNSDFKGFVESAEILETHPNPQLSGEGEDNHEEYWDTSAIYRIVMTDASFLEHLSTNDVWFGR